MSLDTGIKSYYGGKGASGVWETLANLTPYHKIRIIPFAGNCALTRNIKPAEEMNILFDLSDEVINGWKAATKGLNNFMVIQGDVFEYLSDTNFCETYIYHGNKVPTFIHADPPYLLSTIKHPVAEYEFMLTEELHIELLKMVNRFAKVANIQMCCYQNNLYGHYLSNWHFKDYESPTRRERATERVYFNYPEPTELQDYSIAGMEYRQREKIKRRVKNNPKRLTEIEDIIERHAIMDAILQKIPLSLIERVYNERRNNSKVQLNSIIDDNSTL